jgi:hypothetical protein
VQKLTYKHLQFDKNFRGNTPGTLLKEREEKEDRRAKEGT